MTKKAEILAAGEQGIKDCKAGFRAKYIIDACEKYVAGELDEKKLLAADYNEAVEILKSVKGLSLIHIWKHHITHSYCRSHRFGKSSHIYYFFPAIYTLK